MIEQLEATEMNCTKCGAVCAKAGKRPDGMQRYRCGGCAVTFSESKEQANVFGTKQAVSDVKALLALQLLVEGNSIRSTERITGLHRDTITSLLLKAGARCETLMNEKVRNVPATDVQADEIWAFVGKKEGNRTFEDRDREFIGEAWTFIAVERNTKLILAFEFGKRNMESTRKFMRKLARATSADTRFQLSTDGFATYEYAVGMELEGRCDYARIVKTYANPSNEERHRYSPGKVVAVKKTDVYGDPDYDLISTSHIERQNGSLRQWCKRLTRLTYAFSKKWENLHAALALHFAYTNFCRSHRTIKKTPAMAAGLTDHVWTLAEMLST